MALFLYLKLYHRLVFSTGFTEHKLSISANRPFYNKKLIEHYPTLNYMGKPFHFESEYYRMVHNDSVEKPFFFLILYFLYYSFINSTIEQMPIYVIIIMNTMFFHYLESYATLAGGRITNSQDECWIQNCLYICNRSSNR